MSIKLNKLAAEFNRYFTSSNGVDVPERVCVSRDEWRQLYAALHAYGHATQPAEVTDEQIAACVKRASTYGLPFVGLLNPGGTPSDFSKRFTAEILALRPVQVSMTDEQHPLMVFAIEAEMGAYQENEIPLAARKAIKAAKTYGITAQAKKEDA